MKPIEINEVIDIPSILTAIAKAKDLNNNDEFFRKLAQVQRLKNQVDNISDQLKSAEMDIKGLIKTKATALYGAEWSAIAGRGYKITKSPTGAMYEILGDTDKKFIEVKVTVDSGAVKDYVKANSKLPDGVGLIQERNSTIKIKVDENNE